ncbi:MAG: hypothetical protein ACR2JG_00840 [Geodermatophilaceae bacterium]
MGRRISPFDDISDSGRQPPITAWLIDQQLRLRGAFVAVGGVAALRQVGLLRERDGASVEPATSPSWESVESAERHVELLAARPGLAMTPAPDPDATQGT